MDKFIVGSSIVSQLLGFINPDIIILPYVGDRMFWWM